MCRKSLVLILLLSTCCAMADENVPLVNPSFEETTAPTTKGAPDWSGGPPGWSVWFSQKAKVSGATLKWEESGGHTGKRCVSLTGCAGSVCVIQKAPVQQGRTYLCSVWAKRSNPKSECLLNIRWAKADGSWAGTGAVKEILSEDVPPHHWTKISVPFTPPRDVAFAVIMLMGNEQGPNDTCWFDDVELVLLPSGAIGISSMQWMHPNLRPIGKPIDTPHIPWGKPAAWGRLPVLFFCKDTHNLREPLELAQRMDLELDYVIPGEGSWYAFNNAEIMQRLRDKYYKVIVVMGAMPPTMLESLAKQRKGLVLVQYPAKVPNTANVREVEKEHFLTEPHDALPQIAVVDKDGNENIVTALKSFKCGTLGPARLALITYGTTCWCLTPNVGFEYHVRTGACYWEAYLQFLARVLLWAAGEEMPAPITLTYADGKFHLSGPTGPVEVIFADKHNNLIKSTGHAPGEIAIPSDLLPGAITCFVSVKDAQGRVIGFACARGVRETLVRILSLQPDKPYYEQNDKVTIKVQTQNASSHMKLFGELEDAFGRVHARAEATAQDTATLLLDPTNRLTAFNWVNVELRDGEKVIDKARWYVLVHLSREEWLKEYQVGTWNAAGYMPPYLDAAFHKMLRQIEHTEGLQGAGGYLSMLSAGLWPISTTYGTIPGYSPHKGPHTVRKPCFSDPDVRQKMADTARQTAQKELPYLPLFGYMRDETSLVDASLDLDTCSCNFCQQRYRKWLKEKYASLDALNQEWGTGYKSWDELGFVTYKEVRGKPTFAPWVMYRSFMDWAWAEGVEWSKQHARQADPGIMLALANTFGPNPFSGRDYYLLCKANDYWMEYNTETRSPMPDGAQRYNFDAMRSFCSKPNHPWIGYRFNDEYIHYAPWWTALHGATGVSPYGALSLAPPAGSWAMIFPTLQHTRRGLLYAKEFRELKSGIGKLLMNSHRVQAPIAILWSQPSMYVAWAMSDETLPTAVSKKNAYTQYFLSRQAFRRSVLASGRQFDYVCEEQIMQDVLKNYRCLVLPATYAISVQLVQKLEDFLSAGGLLIADSGCGLTNASGRPYTNSSPVQRLFNPNRPAGKGRAVLLNCPAMDYPQLSSLWDGLPQIADVTSLDGKKRPSDFELVLLENGDARYLGVLHNYMNDEENYPVRLKLTHKAHVYDIRAGKYLGEKDAIECDLPPGGCALYALLPARVQGIEVHCEAAHLGKPCKVEFEILGAPKGPSVLNIQLRQPDGTPAPHYTRNILAQNDHAAFIIPFAYNDPPGAWKIEVRHVASGVQATAEIQIRYAQK